MTTTSGSQELTSVASSAAVRSFRCLEGIRVCLNFWIVALHVQNLLQHVTDSPDVNKEVFLALFNAPWRMVLSAIGAQVDVFFAISAFLLSTQLLNADNLGGGQWSIKSIIKSIPILIVAFLKRHLRLLPGVWCIVALCWIVGDPCFQIHSLQRVVLHLSTMLPLRPLPIAALITWSNTVETVAAVVLTLVVLLFGSTLRSTSSTNKGYWLCLLLFLASNIPLLVNLHLYPEFTAANRDQAADGHLLSWMSPRVVHWLRDAYPRMTAVRASMHPEVVHGFFQVFYFPWWNRLAPFFIGLALAIAVRKASKKADSSHNTSFWDKFKQQLKHAFLLLLAALGIFQFLSLAIIKSNRNKSAEGFVDPTISVQQMPMKSGFHPMNVFLMLLARPLFAFGFAYLIYRCVLPVKHPLRFNLLDSFLSASIFQRLGKYTYLIYLLHYRIMFVVMFSVVTPREMDALLGPDRGLLHIACYAVIVIGVSLLISIFLYHAFELPLQRLLVRCVKSLEQPLLGTAVVSKKDL